jgi:hypothetical protein
MNLKEEGRKILHNDGLLEILKRYGKTKIVGSYDLDLLVEPDIDISISVEEFDIDKYFAVCSEITKKLKPSRVKYIDQSRQKLPFPFKEGYFLGLHILRNNILWKIDCWVFAPETFKAGVAFHDSIKERINSTNRKSILKIKKEIFESPNYNSVDVYNAVLFDNITSLSEFYSWYKEKYSKPFNHE